MNRTAHPFDGRARRFARFALWVFALAAQGEAASARGETAIPPERLRADLAVMREAFETLHPGLLRYNTPETLAAGWANLEESFGESRTLAEAFLEISKFLAGIRCGHTYCNFWNQTGEVKEEVFARTGKVPFAFRIIENRIYVSRDATADGELPPGTEITSINGVAAGEALGRLAEYVKADGQNDAKRLYDLQITGFGEFEAFDIFFPLLYPPSEGAYEFGARRRGEEQTRPFRAKAISRAERRAKLAERYGDKEETPDTLWHLKILSPGIGYLRLGTFVTWNGLGDWQKRLDAAFAKIKAEGIEHLIVDIRGNEGGEDRPRDYAVRRLVPAPLELPARRDLLRYEKVPQGLDPYLESWDAGFKNREGRLERVDERFFAFKNSRPAPRKITPAEGAFAGKIYLLIDAANSSASFYMAAMLKGQPQATLVGQTTGGSRRGTNGGQLFFLRLPNSKIEIDLPLVGSFPVGDEPDEGIQPDVVVKPSPEHLVSGTDAELEAALRLISDSRASGGGP